MSETEYSDPLGPASPGGTAYSTVLGRARVAPGPLAPDTGIEGTLGCGVYEALILTRGGGTIVCDYPWTSLSWSRVLDDTSDGAGGIDGVPENCCDDLAGISPWRHELAMYRDGDLVWVGPVKVPRAQPDQFDVSAAGITAWWDHRLIHENHDYSTETDLATIFQQISDDAMAPDPSPGLEVSTTPSGVLGTMEILATQHLLAGTKLRELSKIGVDWTEVGRTVVAGGAVVPSAGVLGPFLDEHFISPPNPRLDGSSQANAWLVKGSGGGAAGDEVYAYDADPGAALIDGLLESVASVSTIENFDSALAAARSRLALTSNVIAVENCVLSPDAPFTIDQLVPGVACRLALEETCIPVFGLYRLQKVAGNVSAPDGERITLTFQPLGSTDEAAA